MQGQPTHSGAGKEHRGWMGEVEGNEKEGERTVCMRDYHSEIHKDGEEGP